MNGPFGNGFPYVNFHEMNMDWIIRIAKDFLDQYTNIQQTIDQGLEDLDTKATELQALLDAWYEEHSQDIADHLAGALQDLNTWYTQHESYLDQYLQDSITAFGEAADEKAAETIATIPDDYSALSNTVLDIKNAYTHKIPNIAESKNIFNPYSFDIENGVLYGSDGISVDNASWCNLKVPVLPNKKVYLCTDTNIRTITCYYASDDSVVSGGRDGTANVLINTGATIAYIRISVTIANKEKVALVYAESPVTYIPYYNNWPSENFNVYSKDELAKYLNLVDYFQLIDSTKYVEGYWFSSLDGNMNANSAWCYQAFAVEPGDTFSITNARHMISYFNNTTFISGFENFNDDTFVVPASTNKMIVSFPKSRKDNIIVVKSATKETNGKARIKNDLLFPTDSVITYTYIDVTNSDNLRTIFESINDGSFDKRYCIRLAEGEYDISSYYTAQEISDSGFQGLFAPRWTKIMGIGNRENVILKWENDTQNSKISTLNIYQSTDLENLTVKAENIRYAIHDDFGSNAWNYANKDTYTRHISNCIFEAVDSPINPAFGAGYNSGVHYQFTNCIFKTNAGNALFMHNWTDSENSADIRFTNCRFIVPDASGSAVLLTSLNTDAVVNYIYFYGCGANKGITMKEENTSSYGTGNKVKLSGYANTFHNSDVSLQFHDSIDYTSWIDFI